MRGQEGQVVTHRVPEEVSTQKKGTDSQEAAAAMEERSAEGKNGRGGSDQKFNLGVGTEDTGCGVLGPGAGTQGWQNAF